jgi:hypothetical protein
MEAIAPTTSSATKRDQRVRNYMFVTYNWVHSDLDFYKLCIDSNLASYIIVGEEICPTTNTPHLQGYIMCKNKHSIKSLIAAMNKIGAHTNLSFSNVWLQNHQQIINYCKGLVEKKQPSGTSKEDWTAQKFHEFGTPPKGQGNRTDLDAVIDIVNDGGSLYDVAVQCPQQFIKFNGGIAKWQAMLEKPRNWPMTVYWLFGRTGTGKSRWAAENTETPYYKDPNTKWWCGYAGQKEVIIDDFRPSKEMPFNFMLALLDRYPMMVQSKHGNHQFVSKKIFITCPNDIDTTLTDMGWLGTEQKDQFRRRITQEIHFTKDCIIPHLTVGEEPLLLPQHPLPTAQTSSTAALLLLSQEEAQSTHITEDLTVSTSTESSPVSHVRKSRRILPDSQESI